MAHHRVLPFRATLSVKLALVLFGAVAGALLVVYLMMVPRLEDRLVNAKIRDVRSAAVPVRDQIRRQNGAVVGTEDAVSASASNLNGRVVYFTRVDETLVPSADSNTLSGDTVSGDPVALQATDFGYVVAGRVKRDGREYAEAATPVTDQNVVLLIAPLDDALANVRLVRRSLVIAGLVALLAAAVAAYFAAYGLTRRLRRLEAAADRIAAGDFSEPVATGGDDEIADLAREFDLMRIRLADLDRVRREFIANASHELRTPLFSLGGFLELLDDEDLDPETRREFVAETRTQVDRLTRLATDLLDLSRLDAGQLRVEKGTIDLAESARTLAEEFRAVADTSGHPLVAVAEDPVPAVGDAVRVLQIGRALVENALRHTPQGTPIEVRAGRENDGAVLEVEDEGPGIPEWEQERVFERFYRSPGGQASGSGLGLSIAAVLASRMGGRLEVDSKPGRTVFRLALPAADAEIPRENVDRAEPQPV
jgi:signal transduction histidine kinase